ncbi:MAG: SpoIIE family protein phosphatase [Candidatus Zixiibacteriota bacterium]
MTIAELEHFHALLLDKEAAVSEWLSAQRAVGDSDTVKAQDLLKQIREGIRRIEDRSFGACAVCHDAVELHRLEIQPITQICLGCISPEETAELEQDLFLASKIHRALLPQSVARIDGFELAVRSMAARIVGGDYYDFLTESPNGYPIVVIADVMGKGLPAGLLMSNVQGALQIMAEEQKSPSELLSRLNRWLCRNVPVTKFVSLACVAVEPGNRPVSRLVQANAGHCPPVIIRRDGSTETLEPTGGVLGVHEGFQYDECRHELRSGDILLLYTDGVIEAENEMGEMFGEKQLMSFVSGRRAKPLQSILEDLSRQLQIFRAKPELHDDYTVILLRKLA